MTEAAVAKASINAKGLHHVCPRNFTIPEITERGTVEPFDLNMDVMRDKEKTPDLWFAIDELIEAFCEDQRPKMERVKNFTFPADAPTMKTTAHSVAGAAANLALDGIQKPARILEFACQALSVAPAERSADPVVREEMQALYDDVITRVFCLIAWFDAHGIRGEGDD